MRSDNRKKSKRPKIYATKFVGITPDFLDSFRQMPSDNRENSFYLLVTMLLISAWNFQDPDREFCCAQRSIRDSMGWGYARIRRYRQVLTDAKLLTIKQDDSGRYGNALTYAIDCGRLGIKRRRDRSKRKQNRPYNGCFWGMTRLTLENLPSRIRHGKCPRALWLLANMLVMGDWDARRNEDSFAWSERELQSYVGWNRRTVRRYRHLLVDIEILYLESYGGRSGPAVYTANLEFLGINRTTRAKQPTKIIDLRSLVKAKSI